MALNAEEGMSTASVVVDASPAPDKHGRDFGIAQMTQSPAELPEQGHEDAVGDPPAIVVSTPSGKTARINQAC